MVGLHVQLDVEYASDEKLIDAGPLAELLYVRSLCFAKRTMLDGKITWSQLGALAHGIPSWRKQADRLIATGAYRKSATGIVIAGWLKRNKSAAKLRAESDRKTREALERNHKRWHIDERKPNATCPLCYPDDEHPSADQHTDPSTDQPADPTTECTEVETETEAYPEAESQAESESFSLGAAHGDARERSIIDALNRTLGTANTPTEKTNRNRTIRELTDVGADDRLIEMRCAAYHRRWPTVRLTDAALRKYWTSLAADTEGTEPATTRAAGVNRQFPDHDPNCPRCDGTGIHSWTDDDGQAWAQPCAGLRVVGESA